MTGKVGRVIPTSGTEVFKGAEHDGKGLVAQSRGRFSDGGTLKGVLIDFKAPLLFAD